MSDDNLLIIGNQDIALEEFDAVNELLLNQLEAKAGEEHPLDIETNDDAEDTKSSNTEEEEIAELENTELYALSNFVGSKPNTKIEAQLNGENADLQLADFSPLDQDTLSAEQAFLLQELGFSRFFNQNNEGSFLSLGLVFIDSFLNSLRNGSRLDYDGFDNNNFSTDYSNQSNFLTISSQPTPPLYTGPTISRNSALLTVEDTSGAVVSSSILRTTDINTMGFDLIYTMTSAPLYGQLELTTNPAIAITTFTQDDLDYNLVIYVHNGNETPSADGFTFDITDGTTTLIGRTFDITVKDFTGADDLVMLRSPTPDIQVDFGGDGVGIAENILIIDDDRFQVDSNINVGKIYLFDSITGDLITEINNPNPGENDRFGDRYTISGNNLIVSVSNDDVGASNAGSIYVFDLTTGALLTEINNPAVADTDFALFTEVRGNNLISYNFFDDTGAFNAGSIDVFDLTTGTLIADIDNPNPENGDVFGNRSTIVGNDLIVSVPSDGGAGFFTGTVYIFDILTGNLKIEINNPTPQFGDSFGSSIDVIGNNLIISAPSDNTGASASGSIYIYDATTGALLHTINNPTPQFLDSFGNDIKILGNNIIVTVNNDDTGATDAGSIYIYDVNTGSLLHTINNPTPEVGDKFGRNGSLIGSGSIIVDNILIVSVENDDTGATDAGSIYVYDIMTGALLQTINNPTPEAGDKFGGSSRFDAKPFQVTANNLIVGAESDNTGATNAGSIYIYDITTGGLLHTISNPTPETDDLFGEYFLIEENTLIVSVENDNTSASNGGVVYIYDISTGTLLAEINNPIPEADSNFGSNIKIIGDDNILIQAESSTFGNIFYNYRIDFNEDGIVDGTDNSDMLYGLNGNDVLYGGAGADTLFGGNGADTFVFENGAVFAAEDRIEDFSVGENDVLDISDILIGYDFGTDNISDFAQFVDSGADSYLEIDTNGAVGGANFESVAIIVGGAGLDTAILEASGNLNSVV